MTETPLQKRIREISEQRKAEKLAKEAQEKADREAYADVIPEMPFERTQEQTNIDTICDKLDILDAYNRWCRKMRAVARPGQRESIKLRCPNPSHTDRNPSFWVNTDIGAGNCAVCGGIDKYDIAAWGLGYDVPGYKAEFHKLKKDIAVDLGYRVVSTGGSTYVESPDDDTETKTDTEDSGDTQDSSDSPDSIDSTDEPYDPTKPNTEPVPEQENVAPVVAIYDENDDLLKPATLDWKRLVPENTFLWEYMRATTVNESPEEYHFFNALMAIGFALTRKVSLSRVGQPIYGNFFTCFLGATGVGKSQAARPLKELLENAFPYSTSPGENLGTKIISTPASGEALIIDFQRQEADMSGTSINPTRVSVHGLVDYGELSAIVAKSGPGSSLKPTLMQFYDMDKTIRSHSQRGGEKIAKEPFCSLLTTTQPRAIRDLLSKSDSHSGFLNRFIFVTGEPKEKLFTDIQTVDVLPAVPRLMNIRGWAMGWADTEPMSWHDDALERWDQHYQEHIAKKIKYKDDYALMQRVELFLMKAMMLLSANKHQRLITKQTVEEALRMFDYLIATYEVVTGAMNMTDNQQIVEDVMAQLEKAPKDGVTMNFILRALKRKNYDPIQFRNVFKSLVDVGRIEQLEPAKTGPRTLRYRKAA